MIKQEEKPLRKINQNALSPSSRRIVEASAEIREAPPHYPDYLHTTLCQVGLPRSRTNERVFERRNGNSSLIIEAGKLWIGGEWQDQPLPYGPHPRLIMIHISTEAVRTKSRMIQVGDSTREFLRRLGISQGGGPRGGYTTFKRHMQALTACRLTLGYSDKERNITISTVPIRRFEAWLHHDGRQSVMWPGVIELSHDFYDSLRDHAVPLDPRALSALSHSALALDVYSWLAHRLYRISNSHGVFLSWSNLMEQFGQEYNDVRSFKKRFLIALRQVLVVYPEAKLQLVRGGIRFYPSPQPIPPSKQTVVEILPEKSKYLP